eukprot:GSMAST32.ASY1.ANO1.2350.1 assembled CDS
MLRVIALTVSILTVLSMLKVSDAKIYFQESFGKGWEDRWVQPTKWKPSTQMGKWTSSAGQWYGKKMFDNKDKDLIVQYSVKHEQNIDCGGAYIKLLPPGIDQDSFGGDTKYNVMFGPDICGHSTRKTHIILSYKGNNLQTKNEPRCELDQLSHVYTLILRKDNTYEMQIDGELEKSGRLEDDWSFLKPKMIKDPTQSEPKNWVHEELIPDPTDVKPEGFDDEPENIPDPDAEKPEDWDDDDDGEWEPPMIENENYKNFEIFFQNTWVPKMIPNPEYKGPWVHPLIANPEYVEDDALYHVCFIFLFFLKPKKKKKKKIEFFFFGFFKNFLPKKFFFF